MSDSAAANAQAQYETINAYWELAAFFSASANDPDVFADLSRAARQILSDVAGVESFDDLSRHTEETIMDAARDEALSVCVRSGWTVLGEPLTADEFEILLSTGGPACRIVGELRDGEPCHAEIQWQDWGTSWTRLAGQSCDALDWLAGLFYFGG